MSAKSRITDESAYVLHRYDWSETSLILEVFTRNHGRVALVAKGVKRPTSAFRPVLLPLQPLSLSFSSEGEIRTLKSAEWQGGHVMPTGNALLSGYYANELLLQLIARDDPHPALFEHYGRLVLLLAQGGAVMEAALRSFELLLLQELGSLPLLNVQTGTQEAVLATQLYVLSAEGGLGLTSAQEARFGVAGSQWCQLQTALEDVTPFTALLRVCSGAAGLALKNQLRRVLQYHCAGQGLRTRQLMRDIQSF